MQEMALAGFAPFRCLSGRLQCKPNCKPVEGEEEAGGGREGGIGVKALDRSDTQALGDFR